jgi:sarcosine oxidase subunit beta
VAAGLYWRPEEGGLLFGMSNPEEPPGEAGSIDEDYLALMRTRLHRLVPVVAGLGLRRLWAATIDYTPDHLPIIGPALGPEGPVHGVTVACAGGAGMMWGPAVARVAPTWRWVTAPTCWTLPSSASAGSTTTVAAG